MLSNTCTCTCNVLFFAVYFYSFGPNITPYNNAKVGRDSIFFMTLHIQYTSIPVYQLLSYFIPDIVSVHLVQLHGSVDYFCLFSITFLQSEVCVLFIIVHCSLNMLASGADLGGGDQGDKSPPFLFEVQCACNSL